MAREIFAIIGPLRPPRPDAAIHILPLGPSGSGSLSPLLQAPQPSLQSSRLVRAQGPSIKSVKLEGNRVGEV